MRKISNSAALKCSRMKDFSKYHNADIFTMVEENFEFCCSEMFQNEGFLCTFHREYFHNGWKSSEFYCSEMFQNKGFWNISQDNFTLVEEISCSAAVKCSRMKDFHKYHREYFHHGRKNFEFCCSEMLLIEVFP